MYRRLTQDRTFRALALIPALACALLLGSGCSEKEGASPPDTAMTEAPVMQSAEPEAAPAAEMAEPAPAPVEKKVAAEPVAAAAPASSADGQKVYQASCQSCHAAGVAGAPKLGDKAAWVSRLAKGNDALYASVKNGLNVMPPKGGCMTCSDDELRAAVEYMIKEGS